MPPTTPISYGDAITTDSVATLESLGGNGSTKWQPLALLIVSRDGSRRILNVGNSTLPNLTFFPAYATKPLHSSPLNDFQRWEGCRLVALAMPRETGQQVLLWNQGAHSRAAPKGKRMVGLYVPYTGTPTALLSAEPVNHVPLIHTLRSELSSIAAGWDIFWHSRFVFANHVRQQVVSRLVDGMLAYGWAEIAKVEAAARPGVSPAWKMETALTADIVRMAVGPITGDPALWARRMARNIDVEAFRLRLAKGEIPGVDTLATPWGPTAQTLISTTPTGDVNEKNVAIVEWHEANQVNTEGEILPYHDDELQRPVEKSFGYDYEHEHEHELP